MRFVPSIVKASNVLYILKEYRRRFYRSLFPDIRDTIKNTAKRGQQAENRTVKEDRHAGVTLRQAYFEVLGLKA